MGSVMAANAMIPTGDQMEECLTEHIPYRLFAIDLCQLVMSRVISERDAHRLTIQLGTLATIEADTLAYFTNPVAEHGFMSCRAMLEFLGIGLDSHKNVLKDYRIQKPSTFTLEHFGLQFLTKRDAEDHFHSDASAVHGLVQTVLAAHKGGGHLTYGSGRLDPYALECGCRATRELVNHFLYSALGREIPASGFTLKSTIGDQGGS